MAGVEASGKNVEEAIENALLELGVGRDSVAIEVLSEGKGRAHARVRARLLDDDEEPSVTVVGGAAVQADVEADDDEVDADEDDREEDEDDGDEDEDDAESEGEDQEVDDDAADVAPAAVTAAAAPTAEGEGDGDEYEEDEAEFAAQMLDKMLAMMGIEADVSIRDAETPGDGVGMAKAVLDIEGDDLGILIGRRGETLQSLQYLLNIMVARQVPEQAFFTVDVEGYRRRRERSLNGLARKMADQVKRTKRPVQLEPMPANERRIIHLALADDRYVSTSSSGEGDARQVSIEPRK
jgi:spoIIIJ-associated protein